MQIVEYLKYPNEYLFSVHQYSLSRFIEKMMRRYFVAISRRGESCAESAESAYELEKLTYRTLLTLYISLLQGGSVFLPLYLHEKLYYLLVKLGMCSIYTPYNPRGVFVRWAEKKLTELIVYARTINFLLIMDGNTPLRYTN